MAWTKRELITQAFDVLGYASYNFDLEPEQLQSALRQMDAMLASWNSRGIRLGYPLASSPSASSLDDDSGVPDAAFEAVYMNLAARIGPTIGKMVPPEAKAAARDSYRELLRRAAMPPQMQMPGTLPSGAGNKPWRDNGDPFLREPKDPETVGGDGPLDFN